MSTKKEQPGNEIVDYEALLADMAKASTTIERPSGSTIGIKSGILSYNGNPVQGNKLDVIVIASVHSNLYYEGRYDPNNLEAPVCFAYSVDGEGMAPHPASAKPQHENCAGCPMNAWKSDPDGGRGKACKNGRTLAVIPAGTKPEDVPTAEIAILKPPVTSVKNWQMYVQKLGALFNRPPLAMITQIGSVPDAKSQFKITFTDMGAVDREMLKPLIDRVPAALEVCQKVYEAQDKEPKAPVKENGKF